MASLCSLSLAIVLVIILSLTEHCISIIPYDDRLQYIVPHNLARVEVMMPPVVWNDTVADFAKSYAQERAIDCQLKHSEDTRYGENIAMGNGPLSPAEAVNMWAGEKPDYDYGSNTCKEGKMCGHYTQIVWRDTKSIGCAAAQCQNGGTFITCNYYPPGNYIGERPY